MDTQSIKYLTESEFKDFNACASDVFHFSQYIKVIHPIRGKVSFDLYPYQKSVLLQFLKNRFNIILKFRQAGVTELISMYCLWLAMFHPNKNIVIISIKDRVAKKVLKKIKYMYKNLPEHLQLDIVNGRRGEYGTAQEMNFSNGSLIASIPTTEDAGRSEAVSLLVIDEAAIVRWANQIWAASFPTLSCNVYDTPIFIRKYITKGRRKLKETGIRDIGSISPKKKGVRDISKRGYYTLSHKGNWKKINAVQNKGELEAWYVEDNRGKINGFTPAHRLYTIEGWKTLREIIEERIKVVMVDTGVDNLEIPIVTEKPKKEIWKTVEEFNDYEVSNLGNVRKKSHSDSRYIFQRENKDGYLRVSLTNGMKRGTGSESNRAREISYMRPVAKLVYLAFHGKIPKGYDIDHINCIRTDNYSTNLQTIPRSENIKKSFKHNMNASLTPITGDKLPELKMRGKIINLLEKGKSNSEIAYKLFPRDIHASKHINRIKTREYKSRVYISKLEVIRKSIEPIFDINVEGDSSFISANNFVNHNTGGAAIVNSTPFGIGNWYHNQWVNAVSYKNDFTAIRLFWQMHPERDKEWYRSMSESLGPRRTAQEIDGDFLTSGHTVFDLTDIKAIEDTLTENVPISTRMGGAIRIFEGPKKKSVYYIGSDVATGRSRDFSSFTIMDRLGEEVACGKLRISTDKLADLLYELGMEYNRALVAPESNDIGLAVTNKLQSLNYPNLYYSTKILKEKGKRTAKKEKIPGWLTTTKNRPVIIDELEQDIRNDDIIIKDPFFVQEAYTFIYDETNKPVALGKRKRSSGDAGELDEVSYTDDSIMAKCICNFIRKGKKKSLIVAPR